MSLQKFCVINFVHAYYRMFVMVGTRSVIDVWNTVIIGLEIL